MKRDMELIIRLLKIIEERSAEDSGLEIHLSDVDDSLVQYNLGLISDAGLIKAINATSSGGEMYLPLKLTYSGHDFLDAARNVTIVNKAKDIAQKQGMELFKLPIDIIKGLLVKAATEMLL
ncbi:DUF2513 domain-containing protein [Paenibacillus sp. sgz302251]|uniref:DUF2513 domain-containing protein n=1 Tax=Paenibacillus sp. sgz302251 TaxID=3414493 RepID=UPI003C7BA701